MTDLHINKRLLPYFKQFIFYRRNYSSEQHIGYFLGHKVYINNKVVGWEFKDNMSKTQLERDIDAA